MLKDRPSFLSTEEFESYLRDFGIPLDKWGKGNAKEVGNLFEEISDGDTVLLEEEGCLVRKTSFVNIEVFALIDEKKCVLVEDRQVFNEGTPDERVRRREYLDGSMAEKMHLNEDVNEAVCRTFREELGISSDVFFRITHSGTKDLESPSYPGLRTKYSTNYFRARLLGDQIKPEGYVEISKDKTTYFVWKKV